MLSRSSSSPTGRVWTPPLIPSRLNKFGVTVIAVTKAFLVDHQRKFDAYRKSHFIRLNGWPEERQAKGKPEPWVASWQRGSIEGYDLHRRGMGDAFIQVPL